jgi:hypothetical protein
MPLNTFWSKVLRDDDEYWPLPSSMLWRLKGIHKHKFSKKISLSFLRFSPEFRSSNIYAVTEHTQNQIFFERYPKNFFLQNLHCGPEHTRNRFHRPLSIRGTNFRACSASGKMWTVLHVLSMLSIRGTNFIAHWAYAERISSHAEHTRNRFHRMLSMRGNI